ncbi:ADP-dependent (S)-NAD(P)H-hydrate dehydratase [Ferrigenium kumadai]|uniref:ADP-dependent (S)-NAD(P)H-hydrate dehydratase n=1 Tax=Ferrigenium kumadai TaxID=1682490 RepID=A0AAN1W0X6_9PROT|nr:NAD(P)H-hydrate dehydratase [Ferrigenium kumadai]BBI99902.1 ADP-dependent (S)-NAD(P)H-hydrate dehydratase [Ferrigenium kumadai]
MSKRIPALTSRQVMSSFPKRPKDSHKGQFGTVVVIGGASGMVGAPLMAARAALKLGAGCVHVGLMANNAPAVDPMQPELMLHPAAAALKLTGMDVLAIGCGLGRDLAAQKLLHDAMNTNAALVLDADALNILAQRPDLRTTLLGRNAATVITPHPGEAARLLGMEIDEVQADRPDAVQKLAQKFGSSVVLKGADSLCATRDGKLHVNKAGNPGMSAPGMGDVLTGMIAAFIAQGMSADDALLLAVHLHGAAGDELAKQVATIGMTSTEVTEWARWLLNQWA